MPGCPPDMGIPEGGIGALNCWPVYAKKEH